MPLVRACRNRWCPEHASDDGWCDRHRKPPFAGAADAYADPAWPAIRAAHLAAFPRCAECGQAATEVHHDGPRRDRLVSLCHRCHQRITSREGGWLSRP